MVYMDEWEYHLWLELHKDDKSALLEAAETDSEEAVE